MRIAFGLIAWVVLSLPIAVAMDDLKLVAIAAVLGFFVLHGVLTAMLPHGSLSAMCIVMLGAISCASIAYRVAVWISPPVVEGHAVMPIGQLFASAVAGPLVALVGWVIYAKILGRNRDHERLLVHAVGAVALIAAVVTALV